MFVLTLRVSRSLPPSLGALRESHRALKSIPLIQIAATQITRFVTT